MKKREVEKGKKQRKKKSYGRKSVIENFKEDERDEKTNKKIKVKT